MTELPRCSRHASARAGWRCRGCQALLCPGCAFVRVVGTVQLVSCGRCGEAADPLTVRRAEQRSYIARLPGAWVGLFTPGGLLTMLAAAALMWLLTHFWVPGAVIRLGVFWGLLFAAIRQAARGERGLEPPDLGDLFDDVGRPALLGLLATTIVWGPAVAWIFFRPGGLHAPMASDPVLWVVLAAGVLYVPMALVHAAMGGSFSQMLNPLTIGTAAVRLGRDYLVAVGVACVMVALDLSLMVVGANLLGDVPMLSGVLRELVGLPGPLLLARSLGLLVHVRGDAVGLGVPLDYLDPVLPGATPRGNPPAPAQRPEPAAAADEPAIGAAARIQAIELDAPAPDVAEAARIAEDVGRGDLASAARRYASLVASPAGLSASVLFQVARGAAGAGDFLLAARALQVAARSGDPGVAPDALLVLARICLQKLNRPADARAILDRLVARYPDSAAARQAHQLLAQAGVT